MATVNLPVVAIDDTQIPRLRAALRWALIGAGLDKYADEINALTDAQLYKRWVIGKLRATVQDYERQTAIDQAAAGVSAPPAMT